MLVIVLPIKWLGSRKKYLASDEGKAKTEYLQNNTDYNVKLKHVAGLPIPENTVCDVHLTNDKIDIHANNMEFSLDRDKVEDISVKTDEEIQKQYVSSSGGAVGGAMMFGAVGALIGGRAKQKTTKTTTTYLIITYTSNDEVKYVGFDVSNIGTYGANQIIKELDKTKKEKEKKKIEL